MNRTKRTRILITCGVLLIIGIIFLGIAFGLYYGVYKNSFKYEQGHCLIISNNVEAVCDTHFCKYYGVIIISHKVENEILTEKFIVVKELTELATIEKIDSDYSNNTMVKCYYPKKLTDSLRMERDKSDDGNEVALTYASICFGIVGILCISSLISVAIVIYKTGYIF